MTSSEALARGWRPLAATGDLLAATIALALAFLVRIALPLPFTEGLMPIDRIAIFGRELVPVVATQFVLLYFFGLYDPPNPRLRAELTRRLASVGLWQGAALALWLFLSERTFPRSVLLLYVSLDFLLLLGWRRVLHGALRQPRRRVVVVGRGAAAFEIAEQMRLNHWQGLDVVGHVAAPGEDVGGEVPPELGPDLGTVDDVPRLLVDGRVDDIVIAASAQGWRVQLIDRLAGVRPRHTNVLLLPGPFESLIGRTRFRSVQDIPLIEVVRESEWRTRVPTKRLLDLVLGALLLTGALVPMAIVAVLIRLTSAGPVFYRQRRVGLAQREFTLLKFRTMREDAERDTGEVMAVEGDPRLTPIGAALRKARLDELPQLLNVLRGEMSLVGPRPERPGFVQRYREEVPGYAERFSMAPGVTGLAQVRGEYGSSAQNKLRYDLAYIANWSPWLDLTILAQTVKIVLSSRGV